MTLITAFKGTSSEKLINKLQNCDKLILENHREISANQLCGRLNKNKYGLILSFGQRPLIKDKIHFESTARDKSRNEIFTPFDIENALKICKELGISAKRSDNAGTSFCNNIYYYGLDYIKSHLLNTQMCFIHIPYDKNICDFDNFAYKMELFINKINSGE